MVVSNAPEAQRGRTHEPSQDLRYIVRLFVLIETLLTIIRSPATLHSTVVRLLPTVSMVNVGLHPPASATGASLLWRRLRRWIRSHLALE